MPDTSARTYEWYQYPAKWFKEEKFWFDMFTRTASALTAASIAGLAVLLSGLGTHQQRMDLLQILGRTAIFIVAVPLASYIARRRAPKFTILSVTEDDYEIKVGHGAAMSSVNTALTRRNYPFWAEYRDFIMEDLNEQTGLEFQCHPAFLENSYGEYRKALREARKRKEDVVIQAPRTAG